MTKSNATVVVRLFLAAAVLTLALIDPVHVLSVQNGRAIAEAPDATQKAAFEAAKELGTVEAWDAVELWSGGELQSIEAFTNDDGDLVHVQATRDSEGLQVQTNDGAYETPAVLPISHWNAALLEGGPLLNGMTGEVDEVQVFDQGLDTVSTRNGSLRARHYLYSGDLNGEIWYDEDGRWVKLRFRANDGSMIDYICRKCQAPTTITEAE